MGNLLTIVIGIILVYFASQYSFWLGLVVFLLFCAFIIYRSYTNICIAIAMRNQAKGEMDKCFAWFERARKHGMSVTQRVNYAYYLMRDGRLEQSQEIYSRLLSYRLKQEDKNYAKSNYAILKWKQGDIDGAIEELEEIFPYYRTTNVYGTLGYMYILKGDLEKAKAFNDEAYEYNNENTIILDNMVQLYHKLGQEEEAERYADELKAQNPTFAEGFYDIALVKFAQKKYEEAAEALWAAQDIKPTFMTTVSQEQIQTLLDQVYAAAPELAQKAEGDSSTEADEA